MSPVIMSPGLVLSIECHYVWLALVGIHCSLIQGKEGRIQVLAGLAPSSQTVAFFKGDTGHKASYNEIFCTGDIRR